MPSFKEFYFTSSTGCNRIRVKQCSPDGEPKAIVQIAHGIAEHVDRYTEFMEYLASNGYLAVANDHLGHGKSIRPGELKGVDGEQGQQEAQVPEPEPAVGEQPEGHGQQDNGREKQP